MRVTPASRRIRRSKPSRIHAGRETRSRPWDLGPPVAAYTAAKARIGREGVLTRPVAWGILEPVLVDIHHVPALVRVVGQRVPGQWVVAPAHTEQSAEA